MRLSNVFLPLLALLVLSCSSLPSTPIVEIDAGSVRGFAQDGVKVFRGIPYVAPPVGDLRWQPPQPVTPWSGVRDALDYGPFCPQLPDDYLWFELGEMSEDCLTLNVMTPAQHSREKLPVMVWIHGGGYVNGSGNIPRLNSLAMAQQGIVLVTINYRLTAFGFLTHPAFATGDPARPQGNYGLQDVRASLKWVQKNIAAFGGDPDNVTIFGESAGAGLVNFMVVMPSAAGLFDRAISQSASVAIAPDPYIDRRAGFLQPMNKAGIGLAEKLGVPNATDSSAEVAAALRAVSMEAILAELEQRDRFTPVIDGVLLPDQVGALLASGQFNKVPYITGGNDWEASLGRAIGGGFSPEFAGKLVPANLKAELYAGLEGEALDDTIFGDLVILSGSRYFADQMESAGGPVWRYYLTYTAADRQARQPGAAHTDDIAFVMQTLDTERDLASVSDKDREVSALMSAYWTQFAKTGNPNRADLPDWPAYTESNSAVLQIGDSVTLLEQPFDGRMQFHIERGLGLMERARN